MGQAVSIEFDENSLKILKEVDQIHRNSLINVGLALASKTGYYKTLTGKVENLADVAGLDIANIGDSPKEKDISEKQATKKAAIDWDDL